MAISPTLEIARMTVVKIARQLIEEGCSEEEARQMLVVAERERQRIRGSVVDAELEFAAVEPIIVAGSISGPARFPTFQQAKSLRQAAAPIRAVESMFTDERI